MYPVLDKEIMPGLYIYRNQSVNGSSLPKTSFLIAVSRSCSQSKKANQRGLFICIPLLPFRYAEECLLSNPLEPPCRFATFSESNIAPLMATKNEL